MNDVPPTGRVRRWPLLALAAAQLGLLLLAYSNHFNNSFHFDDFHSIVGNVWIRELRNIPRFFTDATTFSSLPANQSYRPLLLVTYALDYHLGGGLDTFQFHLTNFVLLLCQCAAMFFLFVCLLDRAGPHRLNRYLAFFAAALFSVHAAVAETVNYISARSDLLSTCLIVAALAVYAGWPRSRRWGAYLALYALAALVKPVVLVFPFLVLLYRYWFEPPAGASDKQRPTSARRWWQALMAAVPSLLLTVPLAILHSRMTPPTFSPSSTPRWEYAITQPYVILRYFWRFFLPTDLSADTDLGPFASLADPRVWVGLIFLGALVAIAVIAGLRAATRPIAFGLAWFVITVLPTSSFFPLAEVENDHRLFLPFVGLALGATAGVGLLLKQWVESARIGRRAMVAVAAVAGAVLLLHAWGTHRRNAVWHDEESLWLDVTRKSPENGRGWMNYGLTQMGKGRLDDALACFERALPLTPQYSYLHINIGIAKAAKGQIAEAEESFRKGIVLSTNSAEPYFFYARFLKDRGRFTDALANLRQALEISPAHLDSWHLLMEVLATTGDQKTLRTAAQQTLAVWPEDDLAKAYLRAPGASGTTTGSAQKTVSLTGTPDQLVARSLELYQAGHLEECIAACRKALAAKPDYPEAYNNICAAYNALHRWDDAIPACQQALKLKPDFELARNNLRWAETSKAGTKH